MDCRIASVLEDAFPDREVDDVRSTGPSWNEQNRTVGIDFADGKRIFLKIASDGTGSRITRERAVIAYAGGNCEVPVPTVLASDTDGRVPHLATAPMSGQSLLDAWSGSDLEERATIVREVGKALASVHAVRFEDHGHVVGGDADDLELRTGSWTDVLVDTIEEMRDIADPGRFDHHFDEVRAVVEANRALLDDAPAALLHGDPAQPNCFRGEEGVGFIDWEIAHVGDPVREIYRARDQQFEPLRTDAPDELVRALHEGYRERAGGLPDGFDDRRPIYEAVRFLGKSGFFENWTDFVDEPPEELATWMREEMNRRLAEI